MTETRPAEQAATAIEGGEDDEGAARGAVEPGLGMRAALRGEGLLLLEVLALTSFAVARPVFDTFGRSTEALLARGAGRWDVVLFGLAVFAGPALVVTAVVAGTRALGERARRLGHVVLVGLAGVLAARGLADSLLGSATWLLWAIAVVGGIALALARLRWASVASFLRLAGAVSVAFLLQFLAFSPASALVMGGRTGGASDEAMAAVAAGAGDDAPPIVMVVLDGLPTEMVLDGTGRIDAELFPNLAALSDDSTLYRNHTTVAPVTLRALPAILTGRMPGDAQPVTANYPDNLFTLLGGSYDLHVQERITGLCPTGLCPAPGASLPRLLGDAADEWRRDVSHETLENGLPQALDADRIDHFDEWIDATDFADDGGDPDLFFYHHLVPHDPWDFLPDGSTYGASVRPSGIFLGFWGDWGYQVARQRHVLQAQAADQGLGHLIDRLREAGTYDDALVVVTADHGWGFTANEPVRGPTDGNADDILWTPLVVKEPRQREGRIDDTNMKTIDIVPTIADVLGIDLPFDVDGVPPAEAAERDPGDKEIYGWSDGAAGENPESGIVYELHDVDGRRAFRRVLEGDAVPGEGPRAVWQRDASYGQLVGRDVADLDRGEAVPDIVVEVEDLDRWSHVDTDDRPPLEIVGIAPIPLDSTVAVTVNDTVAAVVPPAPTPYGVSVVHALLWPGALRDGNNDVGFAVIEGDRDAPILRPLDVQAKP